MIFKKTFHTKVLIIHRYVDFINIVLNNGRGVLRQKKKKNSMHVREFFMIYFSDNTTPCFFFFLQHLTILLNYVFLEIK
jgi:hypothetical protein